MYKLSALVWIYLGVCLYIEGTCDTYKYISFRVKPAGEKSWGLGEERNPSSFSFLPLPKEPHSYTGCSPGDGLVVASWESGVWPEPPVGDKGRCLAGEGAQC